ncbi:longitudinals lacking protein, isoforms H/M/V isoform X1 [Hyalella azteca]|uniref:Longitudinals lacking protein, isoforms H/M/V isoform X1 n=1 Tax=Hyalella azteca TaxID=294128 RepID=A0A8B7PAS5_HYAAZ|nr:longitudinals lacking protein, isoforms H/M/V isoform X1 [Hyalella azteca]
MATGLLSLKWNNHRSTFFHVLSNIRSKESYSDVTLACDGRFYSLHKFVLSTCSEYFEEMFERTQCKHPVIVLKDINSEDLEALLNYMYVGEVNVVQEKLAGLIKAAECLKIKGLAVPDEDPMESKDNSSIGREQHKRSQRGEDSPRAKRRRRENSSDVSEEILSPVRSRPSGRSRDHHHHHHHHGSHNAKSAPVAPSGDNEDGTRETQGLTDASEEAENSSINANRRSEGSNKNKSSSQIKSKREPEQMMLDGEEEGDVKTELQEADNNDVEEVDNKASLHEQLGLDMRDASNEDYDNAALLDEQHDESNLAGASGYQENSFLWEGDGSLSGFSAEGFTSEASQARQMGNMSQQQGLHSLLTCNSSSRNSLVAVMPPPPRSLQHKDPSLEFLMSFSSGSSASAGESSQASSSCTSFRTSNFEFSTAPNLSPRQQMSEAGKEHAKQMHRCSFCPYVSPLLGNLKTHLRRHTGEKPFSCTFCHYRSTTKNNLMRHKMSVHIDLMDQQSTNNISGMESATNNPT